MTDMFTDWDILSELVCEVELYVKRQGYAVSYDWLATWSLIVSGLSLRRSLWLLRWCCSRIREREARING